MTDGDPWPEEEYTRYLESERRAYAWVMRTYGGMSADQAREEAEGFYVYQPPGTPHRGLVFHDEPWHWAMLGLKGAYYWADHPEFAHPPAEYRALD